MRLSVRLLGLDLLDVELTTDATDDGCSLDGGTLGYDRIEPGECDRYLGFTNGREVE